MAANYTNIYPQQNCSATPQFFPQSQGGVYLVNSSLDAMNVPVSTGVSIALCLSEGLMYLKSMQNGMPMFVTYKVTPYEQTQVPTQQKQTQAVAQPQDYDKDNLERRFSSIDDRMASIEKLLNEISMKRGGKVNYDLD